MTTHQDPISVFLSYSDEDEPLLRKLETHLSLLKRQGLISTWDNRRLIPGMDWAKEVDQRLERASIILLLVSADFLASDYCYLCAYLSPDAIPYEVFTKSGRILGPILGPVATNELVLNKAIALLRKHSLIKNEVDRETDVSRLFIHRMLQEILRDGMDPQTQRLWAERAVRVVAQALPFVEWQVMQAHVRNCMLLIGQWKMSFREADLIRQYVEAEQN